MRCTRADLFNDPFDSYDFRKDLSKSMNANHSYVSCFTEKHDNMCMWSHYANEHRGICIEYDFNDCKEVFPIIYTDVPKIYDYVFPQFIKSTDWKYEEEWRYLELKSFSSIIPLMLDGEELPKGYSVKFIMPSAIYFGCKAENKDIDKTINKLQETDKK